MSNTRDQLRKAAVLISALDQRSADALLDQMGEEQAMLVRNAVLELGEVDAAEQERIVAEFVSGGPSAPRRREDDGVELELSAAARNEGARRSSPDGFSGDGRPPFHFLSDAPTRALVERLGRERPQTAALVLAHLPPRRAADVLAGFPTGFQVDVLRRIAARSVADPQALRELEDGLASAFADLLRSEPSPDGLEALNAILSAASADVRGSMVSNLAQQDRRLVASLGYAAESPATRNTHRAWTETSVTPNDADDFALPWREIAAETAPPPAAGSDNDEAPVQEQSIEVVDELPPVAAARVDFDELARLDDQILAAVIQQADRETLLLALAGADATVVSRLLRPLSARDVKKFRKQMQKMEPILLSDIGRAQQMIADLATNLSARRKGSRPPAPRLAAFA